jgi:hypothetical protein
MSPVKRYDAQEDRAAEGRHGGVAVREVIRDPGRRHRHKLIEAVPTAVRSVQLEVSPATLGVVVHTPTTPVLS